jgi:hypothetical protein
MLTYPKKASMEPLFSSGMLLGFAGKRLIQNPKETQQARGDFLHFIVSQTLTEFVLVCRFELPDGFTAQLLRCFHAVYSTGALMTEKGGWFCLIRQVRHFRAGELTF